jgi:hypothetical protein
MGSTILQQQLPDSSTTSQLLAIQIWPEPAAMQHLPPWLGFLNAIFIHNMYTAAMPMTLHHLPSGISRTLPNTTVRYQCLENKHTSIHKVWV